MIQPLNVFYFECPNFGDAINPFIFGKITGRPIRRCNILATKQHVVGIGSIANWANPNSIVIGSGLANKTDEINPHCTIRLLRGPISADIARTGGNKSNFHLGDPVLALPKLLPINRAKTHDYGIIPHYVDYEKTMVLVGNKHPNVKVLDITTNPMLFIKDVFSCRKILSSSLHGLILADAYGIPNVKISISDSLFGDGTKFLDYYLSVGREFKEYPIEEVVNVETGTVANVFGDVKVKDLTENIIKSFSDLKTKPPVNAMWR